MEDAIFDLTRDDWTYLGAACWVYTEPETQIRTDILCVYYVDENEKGIQKLRIRLPSGFKYVVSRNFEVLPNYKELILREFEKLQSEEYCFNPKIVILLDVPTDCLIEKIESMAECTVVKKYPKKKQ